MPGLAIASTTHTDSTITTAKCSVDAYSHALSAWIKSRHCIYFQKSLLEERTPEAPSCIVYLSNVYLHLWKHKTDSEHCADIFFFTKDPGKLVIFTTSRPVASCLMQIKTRRLFNLPNQGKDSFKNQQSDSWIWVFNHLIHTVSAQTVARLQLTTGQVYGNWM